jgi:hypothetical protein
MQHSCSVKNQNCDKKLEKQIQYIFIQSAQFL